MHSRLRPCRCRLVSADSSPLTVKGELELNVGFPGLCCFLDCVPGHVVCGGQYWFGWPAGYGSPAVMLATPTVSRGSNLRQSLVKDHISCRLMNAYRIDRL